MYFIILSSMFTSPATTISPYSGNPPSTLGKCSRSNLRLLSAALLLISISTLHSAQGGQYDPGLDQRYQIPPPLPVDNGDTSYRIRRQVTNNPSTPDPDTTTTPRTTTFTTFTTTTVTEETTTPTTTSTTTTTHPYPLAPALPDINLDKVAYSKPCLEDSDCSSIRNSVCDMAKSTCICKTGYQTITREFSFTCLARIVGSDCKLDSHCKHDIMNSICKDDVCECKDFERDLGPMKVCMKPEMYEECASNIECPTTTKSSCLSGICQCSLASRFIHSVCTERKFSDTCTNKEQCKHLDSSTCKYHLTGWVCWCKVGFKMVQTNAVNQCEPIKVSDLCETNDDCAHLDHNLCRRIARGGRKSCDCEDGFHGKVNPIKGCTKGGEQDPCRTDEDCMLLMPESVCVDLKGAKTCTCKHNRIPVLINKVFSCKDLALDVACTFNGVRYKCDLFVSNSVCSKKDVCECDKGFEKSVLFPDKCVAIIPVTDHGACTKDSHCNPTSGTKCIDYVCKCEEGKLIRNKKCQPYTLGDSCMYNRHCYEQVKYSRCMKTATSIRGICSCVYGFRQILSPTKVSRNKCKLRVIGDPCSKSDECLLDKLVCNEMTSVCRCTEGYTPLKPPIIKTDPIDSVYCELIYLGAKCRKNADCTAQGLENSRCKLGKCICRKTHFKVRNKCIEVYYHETCKSNNQCHYSVEDSICRTTGSYKNSMPVPVVSATVLSPKRCECPDELFESIKKGVTSCIKSEMYGRCYSDEQCADKLFCVNTMCVCQLFINDKAGVCPKMDLKPKSIKCDSSGYYERISKKCICNLGSTGPKCESKNIRDWWLARESSDVIELLRNDQRAAALDMYRCAGISLRNNNRFVLVLANDVIVQEVILTTAIKSSYTSDHVYPLRSVKIHLLNVLKKKVVCARRVNFYLKGESVKRVKCVRPIQAVGIVFTRSVCILHFLGGCSKGWVLSIQIAYHHIVYR